jgi:calcineurin-like phosphoesterase family protein
MSVFYTADLHFGHANLIEYCSRPWDSADKMDYALIKKWNSTVRDTDTVFVVGDFSLKSITYKGYYRLLLEKLPGEKHLILGNHDKLPAFTYIELGFRTVHTHLQVKIGDVSVDLCHDPSIAGVIDDTWLMHGHIHNLYKTLPGKKVINVGVDVWEYSPVSTEAIKNIIEGG